MAQTEYAKITACLDDLAVELLDSRDYRQASWPVARRAAAENFLIPRADGFVAPTVVRDELYGRAQRLAKTANRLPTLL